MTEACEFAEAMTSLSTMLPFVARFDRATVLAQDLFVSLDRQKRSVSDEAEGSAGLRAIFVYQQLDRTVSFEGPDRLGVGDLRVLQGLLAMATAAGVGRQEANVAVTRVVEGSWQELVRTCGVRTRTPAVSGKRVPTSGGRSGYLQKSLGRLSSVKVRCSDRPDEVEQFLTLDPACDTKDGFRVSLSTELLGALGAGKNGKQYLKVVMEEARLLELDVARLLHFRLSNVNEGTVREYTQAEVEAMIWGTEAARTEAIRKNRRQMFKKAIAAVGALPGWRLEAVPSTRGTWTWRVTRPKSRWEDVRRKT